MNALPRQVRPQARAIALAALRRLDRIRRFSEESFDSDLETQAPSSSDRRLIVELVYGVLRHRGTLDWRLDRVSAKPMAQLPSAVAMVLRLGAYQILYLDRIPISAAVNESVNLARSIGGRDWTGLVNGVLRNLTRHPSLPWPDLTQDPVKALAVRYSCPPWIVERWIAAFGISRAEALCRDTLQIPPLTLRTNTLLGSRDTLSARLLSQGLTVHGTSVSPIGLTVEKSGNPADLPGFKEGWWYIEDEAAQLIPFILDVGPAHDVLDVCAAPGGKTTHLAQLMQNRGRLVAVDRHPDRLNRLIENCGRLGIRNVVSCEWDLVEDGPPPPDLPTTSELKGRREATGWADGFDRILIDVPCSGFGVLRRHPEAKWYKEPSLFTHLPTVQGQLLTNAARLLRPGGVLVYSACSIEPEETQRVVARFCEQHPEFRHDPVERWLPPAGRSLTDGEGNFFTLCNPFNMDGFFAARLTKMEVE